MLMFSPNNKKVVISLMLTVKILNKDNVTNKNRSHEKTHLIKLEGWEVPYCELYQVAYDKIMVLEN